MFSVAHTLVLYLVQEEKLQREMKSEGVGFIGLSSFLRDFQEREKEIRWNHNSFPAPILKDDGRLSEC